MGKGNKENKFKCDMRSCEHTFSSKFSLKRHMQIHLKKKPYTCKFCPKTFTLQQYLTEHEFIHTGVKPYICGVDGCTEAFRQRGKLSIHKKLYHPGLKKFSPDSALFDEEVKIPAEGDLECNFLKPENLGVTQQSIDAVQCKMAANYLQHIGVGSNAQSLSRMAEMQNQVMPCIAHFDEEAGMIATMPFTRNTFGDAQEDPNLNIAALPTFNSRFGGQSHQFQQPRHVRLSAQQANADIDHQLSMLINNASYQNTGIKQILQQQFKQRSSMISHEVSWDGLNHESEAFVNENFRS